MTIKQLKSLKKKKIINFKKLSELSGINYQTLIAKIKRGSELKVTESEAIQKALEKIK